MSDGLRQPNDGTTPTSARCGTCIHWNPERAAKGAWTHPKIPEGESSRWGVCSLIEMPEKRSSLSAFVQDGEDYAADLYTRADFGCSLHKEPT